MKLVAARPLRAEVALDGAGNGFGDDEEIGRGGRGGRRGGGRQPSRGGARGGRGGMPRGGRSPGGGRRMSSQARLARMQRRMQSSAAPEEDLMPEEGELSGREERQERRAARRKRRGRNAKLRHKQKIERLEARSGRKGKRKKSRRGGGSGDAPSAPATVPAAPPSAAPSPYAQPQQPYAAPQQPYPELPPAEEEYDDEGEDVEEEVEDAEEEALEGMRTELGRAVRQGRIERGDAKQMFQRLRGKIAANRDKRDRTRNVRAQQEDAIQAELATARQYQADPKSLRRYEMFLREDNRNLRQGKRRMTWEAWYALHFRAPAPAMTPRQVQAANSNRPASPAAPVQTMTWQQWYASQGVTAPPGTPLNQPVAPPSAQPGWGPLAQLGAGMRIQAANGLRAMTIELRPGLYLVGAVDAKVFQQPVNTMQGEIGVAPMLPGLMLKGAGNAIRNLIQRGRDRRQARQMERQQGGHPLLPGPRGGGFPTAPLTVSGALGCECPGWVQGEDLED